MTLMVCLVCVLFSVAAACFAFAQSNQILRGSGATFPYPLYQKWIELYQRETNVRIIYEPIGSGRGIEQLRERLVDFGATDAFLTPQEAQRESGEIVHIPTCVGAVAIVFNLPTNISLRLTPELLADIFLGKLNRWADQPIVEMNAQASTLSSLPITVVHRSDSSGTTFILTEYLTKVSPCWQQKVGQGKTVAWLGGVGVEGNPGVVEMVKRIPGSIGYVELTYARQENLPVAQIKNRAGHFIEPTLTSVSAAANVEIPADATALITDSPAAAGYPLSAFTYIILYREQYYEQRTEKQALALVDFLRWILYEGQRYCAGLQYAPLPQAAIERAGNNLYSITYRGRPIRNH